MFSIYSKPKDEEKIELGWRGRLKIYLAGVDRSILIKYAPLDIGTVETVGALSCAGNLYMTGAFALIGISVFDGRSMFGLLPIVLAAFGLASFFTLIDRFLFRGAWLAAGLEALSQLTGFEGLVSVRSSRKTRVFIGLRVGLSVTVAILVGVYVNLILYDPDIRSHLLAKNQSQNALLIQKAGSEADSDKSRTTDAIMTETSQINVLNRQIATLRQLRLNDAKRNRVNPATEKQLHDLEARLETENGKLKALNADSARLNANRADTMKREIRSAPEYVPAADGFVARVQALQEIMAESSMVALMVILVEVAAAALDLAALAAKLLGFCPTTYSLVVARLHVTKNTETIDGTIDDLGGEGPEPPEPDGPNDPTPTQPANKNGPFGGGQAANDNIAPEPKRKRGRPRKNPLTINGTGLVVHEGPQTKDQ